MRQRMLCRSFLTWAKPGGPEMGRVELLPPSGLGAPDPWKGRTAETVTIPAGVTITGVIEDQKEEYEG